MEISKYIGIITYSLVLISCADDSYAQSYKAAVVAFRPDKGGPRNLPSEVENLNKDKYVELIKDLRAAGADIIVFPEKGITTLNPDKLDHTFELEPYSIEVPDPPTGIDKNIILSDISTAAKSNQVYVVMNVLEKYKDDYFSTDIVFDKEGKLILKCRKKFLYEEKKYNKSDRAGLCSVKADFGMDRSVTFALLFDTDLLSTIKDDIHHVILTSSLPNKLPFLFGLSLQVGLSVRNQINLLVSGYTDPTNGYGGTGIYFRNGTSKVTIGADAFVIADVPITQNREKEIDVKVASPVVKDLLEGISYEELNMSASFVDNKSFRKEFDDGSYCNMKIDTNGNNIHPYKWMVFSGGAEVLGQQQKVLICALIKPKENRDQKGIVNGAELEISKKGGVFQVLPVSLDVRSDSTMVPANFHYKEDKSGDVTTVTMKLTEKSDLAGFGVLISHGTSVHVTSMVLIGSLIFVGYFRSRLFI